MAQSTDSELIRGLLPRHEVSILAGASGAGKTTVIMQLLRSLIRGELAFGHEADQDIRIGYIAADRTWQSYIKTAAQVDLDLSKMKVRTLVDDPAVDLQKFEASPIEELERLIASMMPIDLVVVDPLVVFLGVDTNKYHLSAARLIRLNKLCQANKVTILGTHHATKARSDYGFKRAQDRISGTSALLGFTSTQLFLASPEETDREDGFTEWHVVSHHAPRRVLLLSRDEHGRFRYEGEDSTAAVSLSNRLIKFMAKAGEEVMTGDIMNALLPHAPNRRAIERALAELKAAGVIASPYRGVYALVGPAATEAS